jgi:hypothetical protein|nr:MAG TPA: hypothetical protein [Caudoviricetes sp.]
MSTIYIEGDEITDSEMIENLQESGYLVIGDSVHSADYTDTELLREIVNKFLISDCFSRQKIYKQIIKEEPKSLDEFNNVDMFEHLDEQGFDFLDHIDTQEIISHLELVGYNVEENTVRIKL